MRKEDLELALLNHMKGQKRGSAEKVGASVGTSRALLTKERGNLTLEKRGLGVPTSASTTH